MNKNRLEAFSDGVFSIVITISILGISIPDGESEGELARIAQHLVSYFLSFLNVGIYWINHHHLLHVLKQVTTGVLWSNLILLFCLSLLPFATDWMGKSHGSQNATTFYGAVLLASGVAYALLIKEVIKADKSSEIKVAFAGTMKEKISIIAYLSAIFISILNHWAAQTIYILIACMWIIPDRRIEQILNK